jgi:hypothetical protein
VLLGVDVGGALVDDELVAPGWFEELGGGAGDVTLACSCWLMRFQ